jgi:protein-disulfide isomerase
MISGCRSSQSDPAFTKTIDNLQGSNALLFQELKSVEMQLVEIRNLLKNGTTTRPSSSRVLPSLPMRMVGSPRKGSPKARVAIIEFGDLQCPYCATFAHEVLPHLEAKYIRTDKVLFIYRHFPLEPIHNRAIRAAAAAECAARQNRFWEMHDALLASQKRLEESDFLANARTLGLVLPTYTMCLNGTTPARVREDVKTAADLALSGTPTFFVGTVMADGAVKVAARLDGAKDLQAFETLLEPLLAAKPSRMEGR